MPSMHFDLIFSEMQDLCEEALLLTSLCFVIECACEKVELSLILTLPGDGSSRRCDQNLGGGRPSYILITSRAVCKEWKDFGDGKNGRLDHILEKRGNPSPPCLNPRRIRIVRKNPETD